MRHPHPETLKRLEEEFENLVALLDNEGMCVKAECGCKSSALVSHIRELFADLKF